MTKRGYGAARRLPRLAPFESRGLAKHATKAPRPVPHELLHLEVDEVDAVPGGCHFAGDDHAMQAKAQAARIAKTLVLHAEGAVHALVLDN